MVEAEQLRKAQLKMLEILIAIDKICVKHDIQYWLAYGTLLGAVRHKGFIPWDDDCDICMMREDYEKFISVVEIELPENLFFQTCNTDTYYFKSMGKIRMNNTKLIETGEKENEKYHQGIFIDIFIMDYYSNFYRKILLIISAFKKLLYKKNKYPKNSYKRFAVQILALIPYCFYSTIKKCLEVLHKFNRKNSDLNYIATELKEAYYVFVDKRYIFPLERKFTFEGVFFYGPNNPDVLLKASYGDYMKIPPIEERHWHAKKIEC